MKTTTPSSLLLSAFLTIAPFASRDLLVAAHGYVNDITIAGRRIPGPNVRQGFRAPGDSPIRQVEDVSPVKVNSPSMACGTNALPASQIADANPGDEVLFNWGAAWPHRVGPILTYMASCGDTPCNQFDASQAQWFKISEQGFKPGTREWFQVDLASGRPSSARIPYNLAPGNYLIRNEVIALHIAATLGGAELFPSCTQLRVGGSGNARPRVEELVRFPGAYAQEDPGLWVKDIYEPGFNYVFPGPRVAELVSGGYGGDPAPAPAPAPAPVPPQDSSNQPDPALPGPINAAPIPNTFVIPPTPTAAPTTPASPPPAPRPTPTRRCKNRKTAAQRAERRRAMEEAAKVAAASPIVTLITPAVVDDDADAPVVGEKRSHVGSFARRHHGKAMRRMHSH